MREETASIATSSAELGAKGDSVAGGPGTPYTRAQNCSVTDER